MSGYPGARFGASIRLPPASTRRRHDSVPPGGDSGGTYAFELGPERPREPPHALIVVCIGQDFPALEKGCQTPGHRSSRSSVRVVRSKPADFVIVADQYTPWPKLWQQVLDLPQEVVRGLGDVDD